MFKTRIAGTAALVTFGLAALGGAVVAAASPANAETGSTSSSGSSASSSSSGSTASSGASTTSASALPSATKTASGASTTSGMTSLSNAPTSKVGSAPTSGVRSSGGSVNISELQKAVSEAVFEVGKSIKPFEDKYPPGKDNLNIPQTFAMQIMMDKLPQTSDMSTGVVSGMNPALASMASAVKN